MTTDLHGPTRPLEFLSPRAFERPGAPGSNGTTPRIRTLIWALAGASAYGAALGAYGLDPLQVLSSAVKLPLLLLLTGALCFPSFHVFQAIRAPEPRSLGDSLDLQARVLAAVGVVWGALAPPLAVIIATTGHYSAAKLLAVGVGTAGGLIGLAHLLAGWRSMGGKSRLGLPVGLLLYLVAFAVVGAQLSWLLRPFLGSPSLPFQLFREFQGDFFGHVLGLLFG